MKMTILFWWIIVMGISVDCRAQLQQTYTQISSATYAGVLVTTGTVVRVDNFVGYSGTANLLARRNEVLVQNLDATYDIYCGFTATVSSSSVVSPTLQGRRISPGGIVNVSIGEGIPYNCIAADGAGASGVRVHIEQARW